MPTRSWVPPRGPVRAARALILGATLWLAAPPMSGSAASPTVLDFGAVCDGTVDDRPAFQAMLAETAGILVPAGRRCRLGSDLVIRSDGAAIRCAPDGEILLQGAFEEAGLLIAGAQGVTIQDCRFDLAGETAVPAIATDDLCSVAKGSCGGGAHDGTPCVEPAECPGGQCLVGAGATGRCRAGPADGQRCSGPADCPGDRSFCEHLNSCWHQRGADILNNEIRNLPDAEFSAIRILGATEGPAARTQDNRILCPSDAEAAITGIRVSSGTTSDNTVRECSIGIAARPLNAATFVSRNTVVFSGRHAADAVGISVIDVNTSTSSVDDNFVRMSAEGGIGIQTGIAPVVGNTVLLGGNDAIGIVAAGLVTANVIRPATGTPPGSGTGIATVGRTGTISSNTIGGLRWGIVPRGGGADDEKDAGAGSINKRVVGNEVMSTHNGVVALTGWHVVGNTINWIPSPPELDGAEERLGAAIWIGDPRPTNFGDYACTEHSLISSNNLHTDREDAYLIAATPIGMRCGTTNRPCRESDGGADVCDGAEVDPCTPVRCEGINIVANEFIRRQGGPASIDLGRGAVTNPIYAAGGTPLIGLVAITGNMSLTPGADAFVALSDDASRYVLGPIDIANNTTTAPATLGFKPHYATNPER